MKRWMVFTYGVSTYALFLGVFLYAAGFIGNFGVPKSLDSPREGSLPAALAVDLLLLTLFALQHSGMARRGFKQRLTRLVPEAAERSTYVMASNLALILLFALWRPIGGVVWDVAHPAGRLVLYGLFAFGFLLVFVSTVLLNHFDLFGLRQVWLYLRQGPYTALRFGIPGPYKLVRHPLYVGWLFAFWAAPTMTVTHLVFALATTGYILAAIRLEERDLVRTFGSVYAEYRRQVPMLVPRLLGRRAAKTEAPAAEAA